MHVVRVDAECTPSATCTLVAERNDLPLNRLRPSPYLNDPHTKNQCTQGDEWIGANTISPE